LTGFYATSVNLSGEDLLWKLCRWKSELSIRAKEGREGFTRDDPGLKEIQLFSGGRWDRVVMEMRGGEDAAVAPGENFSDRSRLGPLSLQLEFNRQPTLRSDSSRMQQRCWILASGSEHHRLSRELQKK
jgi:hypothetical protein